MDFSNEEFGKRIRQERQKKGMTQEQLAEAAGISKQMLSTYERGMKNPTVATAAQLARCLDLSLDFLCGIEGNRLPPTQTTTYADVIESISRWARYLSCNCSIASEDLPEEAWVPIQVTPEDEVEWITTQDFAILKIYNQKIVNFISAWKEMYSLYQRGVISEDIMNTWYAGKITELKNRNIVDDLFIKERHDQWFNVEPEQGKT